MLACQAAAKLLSEKADIQVWHIPDWMSDFNEQNDEADDFDLMSFFGSQSRLLHQMIDSPKTFKEYPYTEAVALESFEYVTKNDLFNPDEYNPDNFPWYTTDDPDVG